MWRLCVTNSDVFAVERSLYVLVAAKQIASLLRTVEAATAVVTDSRSVEMVMKCVGGGY